jgi:hypothetical protein
VAIDAMTPGVLELKTTGSTVSGAPTRFCSWSNAVRVSLAACWSP